MSDETSDDFASLLFEEAKAFLEKYRSQGQRDDSPAYLHAALLLGYCALEAHINNVADDFSDRPEFSTLERSILKEREVILRNGQFELSNTLKMFRLEDRFEFLHRCFQKRPLNKTESWWSSLKAGLELRNGITHPRTPCAVKEREVVDALSAILEAIDTLFQTVYKRPYPGKGRRLDSNLNL